VNAEAFLPLTRRASAVWARWRRGDAATRRSEERGLHPDEAAALKRFERNLEYAGSPGRWFQATGTGIGLKAAIQAVLFAGLRIDVGAVGDVCRALAAVSGEMPFGGPLVLENEVRRQAGAAEREETPLCRPGIDDGEPGEEREVSIQVNGAGAPRKWSASGPAFVKIAATASELGIDLAGPFMNGGKRKLAIAAGYSEASVHLFSQDWRDGRRPDGWTEAATSPTPEPAAAEETVPPATATCPDPAAGAPTWFPVSEPTPGAPGADATYPDGGHLPVDVRALKAERDRLAEQRDNLLRDNAQLLADRNQANLDRAQAERELAEVRARRPEQTPDGGTEPMVPARLVIAWVRACEAEWKLREQYDELKQQCAQAVAVKRDLWKQLTEVLPDHLRDQVV
jgi:hypothetical protein